MSSQMGSSDKHTEEAKVLIGIFTLVFPGKTCLQESQASETGGKSGTMKTYPQQSRIDSGNI